MVVAPRLWTECCQQIAVSLPSDTILRQSQPAVRSPVTTLGCMFQHLSIAVDRIVQLISDEVETGCCDLCSHILRYVRMSGDCFGDRCLALPRVDQEVPGEVSQFLSGCSNSSQFRNWKFTVCRNLFASSSIKCSVNSIPTYFQSSQN